MSICSPRCGAINSLLIAGLLAAAPAFGRPDARPAVSDDGVWAALDQVSPAQEARPAWVRPQVFHAFELNPDLIAGVLAAAPMEGTPAAAHPLRFWVPMPDGSFAPFDAVESPVMAPELQARYPSIRTYLARGVDDPTASARFDWTPLGFHAQILSQAGAVYVDPYSRGDTGLYASYFKRDYARADDGWTCTVLPPPGGPAPGMGDGGDGGGLQSATVQLRTYRLALACTGEYAQFYGGTVAKALAGMVVSVNRVDGVYESELAVRVVLIANDDKVVYTNPNTDPYSNNDGFTMLGQNQTTMTNVIGSANYDIGHVFSTGGGGIAYLGAVCNNSIKAGGVTGLGSPKGDAFDIDYVAHEMGHEFNANHSFNSNSGACSGNRASPHAYENGSGSTIMAYAGICGADDLQSHSDPFFHSESIKEIGAYIAGGGNGCAQKSNSGNNPPTVNAGADYVIPVGTPFTATALSANDPDGNPITYCWEERDLGAAQALADPDNGASPIFRPFAPSADPSRTFPRLSDVIANKTTKGEKYPAKDRTMTLRCTVRDNRPGGGGTGFDDIKVSIFASIGPFIVTSPNTNVTWSGAQTVTWNVAGTDGLLTNTKNVKISLSTDGGLTFPTVLLASTANDGSAGITLPDIDTTKARIKVAATNSVYWDMSNANFTIKPASCYADCNGDKTLDLFDFLCFQSKFSGHDTYADCDKDGQWDLFDFLCFQGTFIAGCP